MYQFAWRPRPKSILSSEELKIAMKNMKKYEKIFDKEDKEKRQQLNSAVLEERRRLATAYLARLAERRAEYEDTHADRIALRDGYDSEDDDNYTIVVKVSSCILLLPPSPHASPSLSFRWRKLS
jgi:translation initiation factor 3 subunit B